METWGATHCPGNSSRQHVQHLWDERKTIKLMQSKMFWYLVLAAQNTDKNLFASIIMVHLVRNLS